MNVEEIRNYCLEKSETTESFPFGESTLVFKVAGKMFALLNLHYPLSVNLKCNPEKAIELREHYSDITPGFHMNKRHWNTIDIEQLSDDTLLKSLINHSYNLVSKKKNKKDKSSL
ncbi:MAG: MmcQ/YjbR family DNA-binding protein [Bacteroidales bacterium]|nr:MmcQ/YjbR family DNA-binding protein [Bacteroidales bacterium]